MKSFRNIIIAHLVLFGSLGLLIYEAKSDLEVSAGVEVHAVGDFYDPLAAQGTWADVGHYGRCWRPRGIAADWRPYCEGHWEWTDCGWFWATDEPWGWACYHYGSWVEDPSAGWCWVPGIEWAPAWVEWRVGGDYVGWAPCAPAGVVVAPALFAFVNVNHFSDPVRRASVVVNNNTIIQRTSQIEGPKREAREIAGHSENVMVTGGPDVATVEKSSGHKFSPVSVVEAARQAPAPASFKPSQKTPALDERSTPTPAITTPSRNNEPPAVTPQTKPSPSIPAGDRKIEPVVPNEIPVERPPPSSKDVHPATPPVETRPATRLPEERPANPAREDRPPSPPREAQPVTPPPHEDSPPPTRGKDQGSKLDIGGTDLAVV